MESGYDNVSWETSGDTRNQTTSPSNTSRDHSKFNSTSPHPPYDSFIPQNTSNLPDNSSSTHSPKFDYLNDQFAQPTNQPRRQSSSAEHKSAVAREIPDSFHGSHNQLDSPATDFDIEIQVSEPRKEGEGSSYPYISFLVSTTKMDRLSSNTIKLKRRRRYKDFAWLHDNLASVYSSVAVPELPGKSRLGIEYISGNRFNSEFVSRRREGLERFITRISLHPILKKTPYFQTFIEAKDWSSQYEEKGKKDLTVFDGISDTLLNSFSKIKSREPEFTQMNEAISRVEENVMRALKVINTIVKNQQDLEKMYKDFSAGWNELAGIETDITSILVSVSNTLALHGSALKTLSDKIEKFFAIELEEHLAYCHVFKNLLKTRDSKQIEHEELLEYYRTADAERERLVNYQSATGVSLVTNFIKGKVRDLRGIDPGVSRQHRIASLKKRCDELQEAAESAKKDMIRFNEDVIIEYEIFNNIKDKDLKRCLLELSNIHIEYFEKSNQVWTELLPKLEELKIDKPTI